jgi:hypothetical protein
MLRVLGCGKGINRLDLERFGSAWRVLPSGAGCGLLIPDKTMAYAILRAFDRMVYVASAFAAHVFSSNAAGRACYVPALIKNGRHAKNVGALRAIPRCMVAGHDAQATMGSI